MTHRFMHVGFAFAGVPKIRDLEPRFGLLGDWVRYSALSWILWTDKPAAEIYEILKPYLDNGDQVLVTRLDLTDSFGELSPWLWSWINSKEYTISTKQPMATIPPPDKAGG